MQRDQTLRGWAGSRGWETLHAPSWERAAASVGMLGLAMLAAVALGEQTVVGSMPSDTVAQRETQVGQGDQAAQAASREVFVGGYSGVSHTHASTVTIRDNAGQTTMTGSPIAWDGRPFKSPIYYGIRVVQWPAVSRIGTMLDFTHAKAISRFEDQAAFTGSHGGKTPDANAKVGDVFKHLEFSHGHNMVTLNGLTRLGNFAVQPYLGAGAGIALPHTEIGFRGENGRTYEYQYAGLVGQGLIGLQVRLGNTVVFVEYKLSFSPYDVPLSGVDGWLLVTDVWRQAKAWVTGQLPPGGRLSTPLLTHHGIGGAMVRVGPWRTAATK